MSQEINKVGTLIRQYRTLEGYTQKQLADKCELSESAIRNYELGIRTPDEETLHKIADALLVNYYLLAESDISNDTGVIHILFEMEKLYGIIPVMKDGEVYLKLSEDVDVRQSQDNTSLKEHLMTWASIKEKLSEGKINEADYFIWKSTYPTTTNKTTSHTDTALHNKIVRALQLGATDKAISEDSTEKSNGKRTKNAPENLTPEQKLFYDTYHKNKE